MWASSSTTSPVTAGRSATASSSSLPASFATKLAELIGNEAAFGDHGAITAKMNGLADPGIAEELCAASRAGGASRPGRARASVAFAPASPGVSDRITVRSVLGRYLEHSRIFRFANGNGPGQPLFLMGSADLMQRNLDMRVEALVPVEDPVHQARLDYILTTMLAPDVVAWELGPDAVWRRAESGATLDAQRRIAGR